MPELNFWSGDVSVSGTVITWKRGFDTASFDKSESDNRQAWTLKLGSLSSFDVPGIGSTSPGSSHEGKEELVVPSCGWSSGPLVPYKPALTD